MKLDEEEVKYISVYRCLSHSFIHYSLTLLPLLFTSQCNIQHALITVVKSQHTLRNEAWWGGFKEYFGLRMFFSFIHSFVRSFIHSSSYLLSSLCIPQRNTENSTDYCCKIKACFAEWILMWRNLRRFRFTRASQLQNSFTPHQTSLLPCAFHNAVLSMQLNTVVKSQHTSHSETWRGVKNTPVYTCISRSFIHSSKSFLPSLCNPKWNI